MNIGTEAGRDLKFNQVFTIYLGDKESKLLKLNYCRPIFTNSQAIKGGYGLRTFEGVKDARRMWDPQGTTLS